MEKLLEYLTQLFKFILRGILGIPAVIIPIAFGVHDKVLMYSLITFVMVDTGLGIWKGIAGVVEEKVSSNKLRLFFNKVISYGAAIIVASQVEKILISRGYSFQIMKFGICDFIIVCESVAELFSIIENWGQLGFKIPKILAKHMEVLKDFEIRKK